MQPGVQEIARRAIVLLGMYRLHCIIMDRPSGSRPGRVRDAVVGAARAACATPTAGAYGHAVSPT